MKKMIKKIKFKEAFRLGSCFKLKTYLIVAFAYVWLLVSIFWA
jgi:hypothetical protein